MNAGITGVLLAGGLARRMGGGDKCLLRLDGERILERVIARAKPQVETLILNANGDPSRFAEFELPVVGDVMGDFAGPLAGILTGMEWARSESPGTKWLVSFATDAPFLPCDMVVRFLNAAEHEHAEIVCAISAQRTHPVFALWSLDLKDELKTAMINEGIRKIDNWTARYKIAHVDFEFGPGEYDPFFNVNRPENLDEAKRLLKQRGSK